VIAIECLTDSEVFSAERLGRLEAAVGDALLRGLVEPMKSRPLGGVPGEWTLAREVVYTAALKETLESLYSVASSDVQEGGVLSTCFVRTSSFAGAASWSRGGEGSVRSLRLTGLSEPLRRGPMLWEAPTTDAMLPDPARLDLTRRNAKGSLATVPDIRALAAWAAAVSPEVARKELRSRFDRTDRDDTDRLMAIVQWSSSPFDANAANAKAIAADWALLHTIAPDGGAGEKTVRRIASTAEARDAARAWLAAHAAYGTPLCEAAVRWLIEEWRAPGLSPADAALVRHTLEAEAARVEPAAPPRFAERSDADEWFRKR
jgi:hypothetical protein